MSAELNPDGEFEAADRWLYGMRRLRRKASELQEESDA